jgi:hypothetical protein
MSFKKTMGMVVFAVSVSAFAQAKPPPPPPAKVATPAPTNMVKDVVLSCPTGTKQVGGAKSVFEASLCMRIGRDGMRIFHGPYVAYWPNGQKQAEGQYDEGFRSGHWVYFDEQGVKNEEINFKMGDYDGQLVEFWPNGQKKLEENYQMGRRQGAHVSYDQAGKVLTKIEYVDNRAVTKN